MIPINSEENLFGIRCSGRENNMAFCGGRTPWALGSKVAGNMVGQSVEQAKTFLGNGQWTKVVNMGQMCVFGR